MDCIAEIDDVSYCLFHEQVFVSNQYRATIEVHEAGPYAAIAVTRSAVAPIRPTRFWGLPGSCRRNSMSGHRLPMLATAWTTARAAMCARGFEVGFTKSGALDTAFAASFTARRELSALPGLPS
jgi:hypothetical protein